MSVFFSSEPVPADRTLAELWELLQKEHFEDAVNLAESVCRNPNASIEFFCGLSLAYGELGYYEDAEDLARTAVGFGEGHWRARHALAVSLMHQGRYLGALDSLGFYRTPEEIYVVRAQVEKMGGYTDSLSVTLQDALQKNVPPALQLYLGYLYGVLADDIPDWPGQAEGFARVARLGDHLAVLLRDLARHRDSPYGEQLGDHVAGIQHLLENAG
jgi:hypothetical protein